MSDQSQPTQECWIYRSSRKQEMYLYLPSKDGFDRIPSALLTRFGRPELVMELALAPGRTLAREDVKLVMRNLREQGYHLQMPPRLEPDLRQGE